MTNKWDLRFLELAWLVAQWSRDPSTQTGAVIVRPDKTVASVGFNGFAKQMIDAPELYAKRETKYERIIHCEMNALLHARETVAGYTLYTYPFASCERCAVHMIQAGIGRFVYPQLPADKEQRWRDSLMRSESYMREAGCATTVIGVTFTAVPCGMAHPNYPQVLCTRKKGHVDGWHGNSQLIWLG